MLAATLLALGSAFVHAAWNLLIKTSDDRAVAAWGQFSAAAALSLIGLAVVGLPGWGATPYLVATGVVHVAYLEGLVAAYTHGDFSLSYPVARGGGAVLAALASVAVLGDHLPPLAWVAITIAGAGLVSLRSGRAIPAADDVILGPLDSSVGPGGAAPLVDPIAADDAPSSAGLARGRAGSGERRALAFAAFTAACIATYTIIDSAGARAADSGVSYGLASVAAGGLGVTLGNLARPSRRARIGTLAAGWRRHLAGGVGTTVAYTMVLVAVRHAPVGYVTMLRESSVVIGALVGWLVLREGLGGRRLASSLVILAGLLLLVAAGR